MIDQKLKYRRFKAYIEGILGRTFTDGEYDDIAETIRVALEQSVMMGRHYDRALLNNPTYAEHLFHLWIHDQNDTQHLLDVMEIVAGQSGQEPTPHPEPVPGPEPAPQPLPGPYPSGLSVVWPLPGDNSPEATAPKEVFCALEVPDGIVVGRYGGGSSPQGGADILLIRDGHATVEHTFNNPIEESVFAMLMTQDGLSLAITEEYGSIAYRESIGKWIKNFTQPEWERLMLSIKQKKDGSIYGLWTHYAGFHSGLVRSLDGGKTFSNYKSYNDLILVGMAIDSDTIYLAGLDQRGQIVVDVDGNTIFSYPNLKDGYQYWPILAKDGKILVGTWNNRRGDHRFTYIDLIINGRREEVYHGGVHPYFQSACELNGVAYFLATRDWDIPKGQKSLLVASHDWKTTEPVCEIPWTHAMTLSPGKDCIYIGCGKKYEVGQLMVYKP